MARTAKQLANLKNIKKGQVLNPEGGRAHNPELRAIKRMTAVEVAEMGSLVLKNDIDSLKKIAKEPGASVLKVMIAAVAVKVIEKGDAHALDILLNRLVGKVKENIEISSITTTVQLTPEEREKQIEHFIRLRKETAEENIIDVTPVKVEDGDGPA